MMLMVALALILAAPHFVFSTARPGSSGHA